MTPSADRPAPVVAARVVSRAGSPSTCPGHDVHESFVAPAPEPDWRQLRAPDDVAAAIVGLYEKRGGTAAGGQVTAVEHALQSGALAMAGRARDPLIVAAFLHDIGHLLVPPTDPDVDHHHEEVGARFLTRWFGDEVTMPIRLHVDAKRALCAGEPGYRRRLAAPVVRSLIVQGGPMDPEAVRHFDDRPFAAAALRLRRWDDAACVPGAPTPTLGVFAGIIADVLRAGTDRQARSRPR